MKKFLLLIMVVVFGCFILSASANAIAIRPYWQWMVENEMGIVNHESLAGDDTDGFLEVGERLRGTAKVLDISGATTSYWVDYAGNVVTIADDGTEITGIFDIEVTAAVYQGPGADLAMGTGDDVYQYNFKPTGNLGAYLPPGTDATTTANTAMAMFIDDVIGDGSRYSSGDIGQTIPGAEADATDGDFFAALGFMGQNLFPTTPGSPNPATTGYWWGIGTQDPDAINTMGAGDFYMGLNCLINMTGIPGFIQINDPNEGIFNIDVDFFANGDLEDAAQGPYQVQSDDPVHVYPTPEPATILILGSGLIGLAGLGRKRLA